MKYFNYIVVITFLVLVYSCQPNGSNEALPFIGNHIIDPNTGDTTYHQIRDFTFVDQDSQLISNDYFTDKAYIADFFFTSCPTICPKVKKQMMRIYDRYENDDRLLLLSHTIDVKHDTVAKLKKYAANLDVDTPKWRFVTGDKDSIYSIAYDYQSTALEDTGAPGGFNHSGYILLIDKDRHLRAYADGTDAEKVDAFFKSIDQLLKEME